MGYTHYWKKKNTATQEKYEVAKSIIKRIIKCSTIKLCNNIGEENTLPKIDNCIHFNGCEKDAHESFWLPEYLKDMRDFEFCKTIRKPYDIIVVACLHILDSLDIVEFNSDGNENELKEGRQLAADFIPKKI